MNEMNRSAVGAPEVDTRRLFGDGGAAEPRRVAIFADLVALVSERLALRHASVYLAGTSAAAQSVQNEVSADELCEIVVAERSTVLIADTHRDRRFARQAGCTSPTGFGSTSVFR